ncbi:B12-binding domain-containing radical SAM protein [Streptacidiphilus rugosus]|uniref:B12-binding domain-containing radical SAM protein n=1 Tax=Streptacidiphilus rugosus TaxID=405783 RepID=UPI00055DA464|nr:B12-binding domain-containing radical SAM protein [Streptacidiphilus rugosus]
MTSTWPAVAAVKKKTVQLVEFTAMHGVRYSVTLGYLKATAVADPELDEACDFRISVREQSGGEQAMDELLDSWDDEPFAVALTVFFWNRAQSLELARRVKLRWPDCRVVLGGNDVSYQQDPLFAEAPWVDVLVHGEGELRFRDLIGCFLAEGDLAAIPGISYWSEGAVVTNADADRITDLEQVVSPILSPVYSDAEITGSSMIVYETNRGCPYKCAFCYWGGATNSKVRQFDLDRIFAELDRLVRLMPTDATLFIADANFGIIARDRQIAEHIVELTRRHDKRLIISTNWAKNGNDRIVEIAGMLHAAELTGAITLSAQSFDPDVLKIANRANIRTDHYRRLLSRFRALDVPTYTDLIWGLPGETHESYLAGAEEVLTAGGSPVIYPLLLLNNTEYSRESFQDKHKLTTRWMPADITNPELVAEVVVAHDTMTTEEWVDGMAFRVSMTLFQKILLRCALRVLHMTTGVRMVELCDQLWSFLLEDCADPFLRAVARNVAAGYREPGDVDMALLRTVIGDRVVVPEEVHFQALLCRAAGTERAARNLLTDAVDRLCARLTAAGHEIDRALVDGALSLDLAATTILRASMRGELHEAEFAVPRRAWDLLVDAGDVPSSLDADGRGATVRGTVWAPPRWVHYPISVYSLSIWHGTGRPLHDLLFALS